MFALIKWIAAAILALIVWLVGLYTIEYFRPYKKIAVSNFDKFRS